MPRFFVAFLLAAGVSATGARHAVAQATWRAELPAAVPVSIAHRTRFETGAMPALAVYWRAERPIAVGLRLRAGAVAGAEPLGPAGTAAPSTAGLVAATIALRVRHRGAWLEAAAGGGLQTGSGLPGSA